MKHEWEKLYRAAVLESDPSKLPKRIANARAAILERSRKLAGSPAVGGNARLYCPSLAHLEFARSG